MESVCQKSVDIRLNSYASIPDTHPRTSFRFRKTSPVFLRLCLGVLACFGPLVALAVADGQPTDFWKTWQKPGVHAIMRHATAPGVGDPEAFTLGDCSTQRNLSAEGRAEAVKTGEAFRAQGPLPDAVYASQWCRTTETARLLNLKEVQPLPSLNSFFEGRGNRNTQTNTLKEFLNSQNPETKLFLVTHQVNISALTGEFASSGEVLLFTIQQGQVQVLARNKFLPN